MEKKEVTEVVDAFADGKTPIFISLTEEREDTAEELAVISRRDSGLDQSTDDFVSVAETQPFMEGYLLKKGAIVRSSWKRRFFRLENDKIHYYHEHGGKFLGSIPLDVYTEVFDSVEIPPSTNSTEGAFQISNSNKRRGNDRIYHLYGSKSEKDKWMDTIRKTVRRLKDEEEERVNKTLSNSRMKLVAAPKKIDLNKSVMVFWETSHEPSSSDWIGVFKAPENSDETTLRMPVLEADKKNMVTWKWVEKVATSASMPFVISTLGEHYFAYFSAKENTFVGRSGVISVGPEFEIYVTDTNERGLDLSSLMMNEVHVKFRQISGNDSYTSAWIGLYKKFEQDNSKYITFKWLSDATNNTLTFDRPSPGDENEPTSWFTISSPSVKGPPPAKKRGGSGGIPTQRGGGGGGGSAVKGRGGGTTGAATQRGGLVRQPSNAGSGLLAGKPLEHNTDWEFRLFPLRSVYIDVARASFSTAKKRKKSKKVLPPVSKELAEGKEKEVSQKGEEEQEVSVIDDDEESVFQLLHKRFAPRGEMPA